MERINRSMTTGCLIMLIVLVLVLATGLSWLWYSDWHAGKVNRERRDRAVSSVLQQARDAADDAARSLDASHTSDVDKLTSVIWQHTASPVITYDASRREFTARLPKQMMYKSVGILPGSNSDVVNRCFDFTYSHPYGQTWTHKVTVRDDDVCRPAADIGYRSRLAKKRIERIDAQSLTRTGLQKALDPTGTFRSFAVKDVARRSGTVVVSVLITSLDATANQCYRITRPAPDSVEADLPPATATPVNSC
ncbi:hypothetical protein AB0I22_36170 [Streptomyces sp. NPDC050610]|uniref:hypothetical protein n=1 Tax=Streptomyces sp. NPDC050610 TaxID=3157097 RepID=UPI00343FD2E9